MFNDSILFMKVSHLLFLCNDSASAGRHLSVYCQRPMVQVFSTVIYIYSIVKRKCNRMLHSFKGIIVRSFPKPLLYFEKLFEGCDYFFNCYK